MLAKIGLRKESECRWIGTFSYSRLEIVCFSTYVGQLCRKGKSPFYQVACHVGACRFPTQPIFYASRWILAELLETKQHLHTEIYCYKKCKAIDFVLEMCMLHTFQKLMRYLILIDSDSARNSENITIPARIHIIPSSTATPEVFDAQCRGSTLMLPRRLDLSTVAARKSSTTG